MKLRLKKNDRTALIILACILAFVIGVVLRYPPHRSLDHLGEKNLPGFIIFEISNLVKAGFWKLHLNPPRTEIIAKNSMDLFKKGDKNRKRYLDPDLSPDGKILVYTLEFQGKKSIALMSSSGTNERPFLELEDANLEKAAFSPDQKSLALISENRVYLTSFPPSGDAELQSVTAAGVENRYLSWLNTMVVGFIGQDGYLKIVDVETANIKSLIKADQGTFSRDGNELAISYRNELSIYEVNRGEGRLDIQLSKKLSFPRKVIGKITWSPAGTHLLVTVTVRKLFKTYSLIAIINIETEEMIFLPRNWRKSTAHTWGTLQGNTSGLEKE